MTASPFLPRFLLIRRAVGTALAGLALAPLTPLAHAQWTSQYPHVNLAGDFNGFDTVSANMVLITNGVWQAYETFTTNTSIQFKFATANFSDPNATWGENNQSDFLAPVNAVAETPGNNNIVLTNTAGRTLRFLLNEVTDEYRVDDVTLAHPWINEVDYDNLGGDSNEWVELAGPAGVSLDAYELLFLNQNGIIYNSNDLAGASFTFQDEGDGVGYFVIGRVRAGLDGPDYTPEDWNSDEIQNGITDSIQLRLKAGARNIHLLDYEGDNPSTDEDQIAGGPDNNTSERTIYLTGGPGTGFADFTWANAPNQETPGAANAGQSLLPPPGLASDVLATNLTNVPGNPDANVPVEIEIDLTPANGPSNVTATAFYRVDGAGPFLPQPMALDNGTTWRTTSPLPGQPPGTVVDYYVFVAFDGFGQTVPVLAPANAPATLGSYGIARLPAGSVWLNELNYRFDFFSTTETNEYVELAGPADSDITGWQIQLLDASTAYATYTLPASTVLPADSNGFGFFVLGDAGVPGVDMVLTNVVSAQRNIANNGVIRLRNELGFIEYEFAYGNPTLTNTYPNAIYIGIDTDVDFFDYPLGLTGAGSSYGEFAWTTNSALSSGSANASQTFEEFVGEPPVVIILDADVTTPSVRILSTGTNTWSVQADYSTNLSAGEPGWTAISSITNSFQNGTNTTTFAPPATASPVIHYRIRQTDP